MDRRPVIPIKPKGKKFKLLKKKQITEMKDSPIKRRKNLGNKFLSKRPACSSGNTVKIEEATIED